MEVAAWGDAGGWVIVDEAGGFCFDGAAVYAGTVLGVKGGAGVRCGCEGACGGDLWILFRVGSGFLHC